MINLTLGKLYHKKPKVHHNIFIINHIKIDLTLSRRLQPARATATTPLVIPLHPCSPDTPEYPLLPTAYNEANYESITLANDTKVGERDDLSLKLIMINDFWVNEEFSGVEV